MYSLLRLILIIATADMSSAIFGGNDSSIYRYPYHAALEKSGRYTCGGNIISTEYILTAAHCVVGLPANNLKVRVGSTYLGKGGYLHDVERTIIHENYRSVLTLGVNDIALVKLKHPVELDFARQAIELQEENPSVGQNASIVGWGYTRRSFLRPLYLQSLVVQIVDKQKCDDAYKAKVGGLHEGHICAGWLGQGGKDACEGDSGGGLNIGGRLAGIITYGESCALPEYPTIYADVVYYRPWIRKHAGV